MKTLRADNASQITAQVLADLVAEEDCDVVTGAQGGQAC